MSRHTDRIVAAVLAVASTFMLLKGVEAVAEAQAAAAAVTPRMARVDTAPASAPKAAVQVATLQR